jgi:hypothetical protein
MSRAAVLLHQLSPEDLQQLRASYKIRDTLLGENPFVQDTMTALELASVCEHPNAVWLTKLFGGRDVDCRREARQVFLGCENNPRALSFAGLLGGRSDDILRAADLGDAFAQAEMAWRTGDEECFRWAEKSAAQGNVMVSSYWDVATEMELDALKTRKEQEKTFRLPLSLGMFMQWFGWASYLKKTIRNDLFGWEELLQMEILPTS